MAELIAMLLFAGGVNYYDDHYWTPEPAIIRALSNGDLMEERPGEPCPAPSDEPTAGCTQISAVPGEPEKSPASPGPPAP